MDPLSSPVTEFFAPFAHVPGRFEWCQVHSPTHGVFSAFVALGPSTSHAADVYVSDDAGASFMAQRYPECRTHRVATEDLMVCEAADRRSVHGLLLASSGPVRRALLHIRARPAARLRQVPYGSDSVWGSRWACRGVDLVLDATAEGVIDAADASVSLRNEPALLALGSYGTLERMPDARSPAATPRGRRAAPRPA